MSYLRLCWTCTDMPEKYLDFPEYAWIPYSGKILRGLNFRYVRGPPSYREY